jgi:mannitol operon transcriptional antiterminator
MYLSARERHIIQYLIEAEQGITIKEIADRLNVSTRTIHRDIQGFEQMLTQYELTLERQSGVGLKLTGRDSKKIELKDLITESEPNEYTPWERQQLLLSILLQQREPVKLFTLAKEIGVTIATISNDLNKINDWLQSFDLEMVRKRSYGIEIQGDEPKKRMALRRLITDKVSEEELVSILESYRLKSELGEQASEKLLYLIDLNVILKVLETLHELRRDGEPIADVSYVGLAVHLSLAVDRIKRGEKIEKHSDGFEKVLKTKEYEAAKRLVERLETTFSIDIPQIEVAYVAMHLLGAKQGDDGSFFLQETSLDIAMRAKKLIEAVGVRSGVALDNDQSLLEGLISHLKPALFRMEQGMKIYNSMLPAIKEDYAPLFSTLKECVIDIFPAWSFPDEEIGYLVMHFGSAIERSKKKAVIKAIVICSSGIGTSKLLATRLEKEIPEIQGITHMSAFDITQDQVPDHTVVISTVPLTSIDSYFLVNPFLSKKEVDRIRQYIHSNNWNPNNKTKEQAAVEEQEVSETKQQIEGENSSDDKWAKETVLSELGHIQQLSSLINSVLSHFKLKSWPVCESQNELIIQLAKDQEDSGLVRNSEIVADALMKREELGGLAIPGTTLALFHTRSDAVDIATFTVHELEESMLLRGMDNEDTEVKRILLMLAPLEWNREGLELMSFISALVIESSESIRQFETGNEQEIFTLLEKKLKEYLITKLQK